MIEYLPLISSVIAVTTLERKVKQLDIIFGCIVVTRLTRPIVWLQIKSTSMISGPVYTARSAIEHCRNLIPLNLHVNAPLRAVNLWFRRLGFVGKHVMAAAFYVDCECVCRTLSSF